MGCTNSKEKPTPTQAQANRPPTTAAQRPATATKQTASPANDNAKAPANNNNTAPTNKNNAAAGNKPNTTAGPSTAAAAGEDSTPPPSTGGTNPSGKTDYKALRQVVLDAEEVLQSMKIADSEKKLVALSFINTLTDVLRQSYRLKKEAVTGAIEELCSDPSIVIHRSVIAKSTHGAREEFLSHLITSWIARNPTGQATLPSEEANEVLLENQIVPWKSVPMRFADCYRELLRIGDNDFTNAIFEKYSEGGSTISSQQFLNFLVDCQHSDTATMKLAEEKTKERFGNVGTRFTFALYLQSLTLNTAQDPRRGGTVWQDMTQPLPQYMVRTNLVDSMDELQSSLAMGSRAIVLHCHEGENGEVMAGDAPFESLLRVIKEDGFTASNYPLMLCLAPEVQLTIDLQYKIAHSLVSILGDELLAKGMMFEGATIKDPKFSPAALQHRVLVLGSQAPLKPFVGFLVADMNRNGLGVKVTNVVAQTPAAKAGVQKGDWFTHINNEPITSKSHLKSILAKLQLGEEFTMRRENLDDVTIVVGGTVEGDITNSKELSDLVFLKFTSESEDHTNSPWDICMSDELGRKTPSPNKNAVRERSASEEAASRDELSSYFRFATLRNPPHQTVTEATHSGVQLICATRSTEDQKWSRGFFADNGSCGYIQKSLSVNKSSRGFRIEVKCPPPHFYNWSICGLRGQLFGEGVLVVHEEKLTLEVTQTDDLAVCTFLLTLMPPNPTASASTVLSPARVSAHVVPTSPNKSLADAIATPIVLSVSVPVAILRLGVRAFESIEEKEEGKVLSMPHYPILAEISAISN